LMAYPAMKSLAAAGRNLLLGATRRPRAGPAGTSAGPCAGRLPRRSRRTPALAWSVLHPDRGCQGQEWGGTDLPWMGAGWTPLPSGADGATSLITRQGDPLQGIWQRVPPRADCGHGQATPRGG
jgi:hypothetical protein